MTLKAKNTKKISWQQKWSGHGRTVRTATTALNVDANVTRNGILAIAAFAALFETEYGQCSVVNIIMQDVHRV